MGRYNHSLLLDATIMVSKYHPSIGEHVVIIFETQQVIIATVWPFKNTLNYSFRGLWFNNGSVIFSFILSTFDKHDKTQLLAKLKKFL